MRRRFFFIVSALVLSSELAGAQQLVYSTFGPGESFGVAPGVTIGAGRIWQLTGNNGVIAAMSFTPQTTVPLSHADFALRYDALTLADGTALNGPHSLDIALTADSDGFPGTILEKFHLTNVLGGVPYPGVSTVLSTSHPILQQGQQYWMVLSPPDLLNTGFDWIFGPSGIASTGYTMKFLTELTSVSSWSGGSFGQGSRPALAIYGGSSSPLPSPIVAQNGIRNAASFAAGAAFAPGSWVSIFGSNLSSTARGWQASDFPGDGSLPISLDGVSVLVNGQTATISYVSPGQLNLLIPDSNAYGSPIPVQVITPAGAGLPVVITLSDLNPALFAFSEGASTYAIATHADGTLVTQTKPAKPGEVVSFYGTGFGPSDPPIASGTLVQNPQPLSYSNELNVSIGGTPAQVLYAGITGAGLDQINVKVPAVATGDQKVEMFLRYPTQNGLMLPVGAQQ